MRGYESLAREFAERIEYYRSLGVNPFSLATGCAVKVDLVDVLYPALKSIRGDLEKLGLTIAPRRDADVFEARLGSIRVMRGIYDVEDPHVAVEELRGFKPRRAVVLAQVHQRIASSPEPFKDIVWRFYSRIAAAVENGISVGKGHSIVSADTRSQFFLVDFMSYDDGGGLVAANNDTIQIIDPAEDPGSVLQTAVALSNSLNDLFTVGAWRNIRVYPVYDAPDGKLRSKILSNMISYAEGIGATIHNPPQPNRGSLLMGATVLAEMTRKPPFFYDRVEPGMRVMVTRPIGELAVVNVYMLVILDKEIAEEFEKQTGISVDDLLEIKSKFLETMAKSNIEVAKVIESRLPELGEDFNPREHIAVTTDVTGPGVYVVKELAELSNTAIRLTDIPLLEPRISEFATRNFIIPNATAGTNGAIVIVARPEVLEGLEEDLRKVGLQPTIIGYIESMGSPVVRAPLKLKRYVASKSYLKEFELA
jgi:selenophosphate synthase